MDSEEMYMNRLFDNLELYHGSIILFRNDCDDDEFDRFSWMPGESEVFDKKLDKSYEPLELCMMILECDEQSAIAWMKERDLG